MTIWLTSVSCLLLLIISSCQSQELVLALEDEFDTFNLSLWKHELTLAGGGNWEFQGYYNNRTNSYVKNGTLFIKPTLLEDQIGIANVMHGFTMDVWGGSPADECTQNSFYGCLRASNVYGHGNILNPIRSARLRTAESFFFKYGKVEVTAKLPKGDWLWPAIWMLPRHNQYGIWPSSGEIDIMESRGNSPDYPHGGYDTFGSTLHWGIDWQNNFFDKTHATKNLSDLADNFHVYGLVWNESYIGTYLDDESDVVLSVSINQSFWSQTGYQSPPWDNPWVGQGDNAPFDQEFYLIINLACGGTTGYWPDGDGKPWENSSPHSINQFYNAKSDWYPTWDGEESALQVDSVRIWTYSSKEKTDTPEPSGTPDPPDQMSGVAKGAYCVSLGVLLLLVAWMFN